MDLRADRQVQSTFLEVYMITHRFDREQGKIRNPDFIPAWVSN